MPKKKLLPIAVVLVLLLLAYLVKLFFFKKEFSYAGTVEITRVDIPARVPSVIKTFEVKEGETVKEGQKLLSLACEDVRIAYDLIKSSYDRTRKLYKGGSIAQEAYDQVNNKMLDTELKLSWCDIASPLKGTVITTYFEPGEMVSPGAKLLTIGDLQNVYAFFYLPHDEIVNLKPGQNISARLPEMDEKEFAGTISYINPEAEFTPKNVQTREERTRLVYGVKVQFANNETLLKPGMTLEWAATKE
ncbi:efflux RND transporter periplasmic adaptor subunit [Bdellovibrio reynosensis]|uniref:Efflux RND transporter periplasmic adaptor subunit n=1 Tax=Bdellovibrio reynosensis TaxID=2835041 RepID=A0ABY4CBE5_9BACT|nr:efflux RND transporter periplasmic adaptor subunit [Bdellovibrio reynosensis]UOF02104.1 efflux RND transporter periplasmic adaptor subunit [Bdellovibrio reynosensis]